MNTYLDGFKACPLCSGDLEHKQIEQDKSRPVCKHCGWIHWSNPVPTASSVIPYNGGVVLVKRAKPPQLDDWACPGGHVEHQESPIDTVVRETKEETNLDVRVVAEIGNPFTTESNHLVMFYLVEVIGGETRAGDDAKELEIFTLDALPENIAWIHHRQAIEDYYAGRNIRPINPQPLPPQNGPNKLNDEHCRLSPKDNNYSPTPNVFVWACIVYVALVLGMCLLTRFIH